MVLDLIVAAIILLAFIINLKKGLVKSVWKIAALILTIVLVIALKTPTVNYLAGTELANRIYSSVSESLSVKLENPASDIEESKDNSVPQYIMSEMIKTVDADSIYDNINSSIEKGTDELARRLTMLTLKIITIVGLFILIRVLLMIVFMILDGASKLPVIGQANALMGGIFGVINALAIIYIVCAIISLLPVNSDVYDLINQSYIVKYFYNYNILLQLIIKV